MRHDLDVHDVAHVGARIYGLGFVERDLGLVVFDGLDDGLLGIDAHAAIPAVDFDGEVHIGEIVFLVGRSKRRLNRFEHDLFW